MPGWSLIDTLIKNPDFAPQFHDFMDQLSPICLAYI